mmetsp:Transcript_2841/g.6677  ORF Transcript_2841/g.6677 Transcript_2841/m.6677 type:complete len:217 (+) Transcript_2841:308-958(+)
MEDPGGRACPTRTVAVLTWRPRHSISKGLGLTHCMADLALPMTMSPGKTSLWRSLSARTGLPARASTTLIRGSLPDTHAPLLSAQTRILRKRLRRPEHLVASMHAAQLEVSRRRRVGSLSLLALEIRIVSSPAAPENPGCNSPDQLWITCLPPWRALKLSQAKCPLATGVNQALQALCRVAVHPMLTMTSATLLWTPGGLSKATVHQMMHSAIATL